MSMETEEKRRLQPKCDWERIVELCSLFYRLGWASGTGGSISIRQGDDIFMAPSGVQKERMLPRDIFVIDMQGRVKEAPQRRDDERPVKLSQCSPLFVTAYKQRDAGAVIHSHSLNAVMATVLAGNGKELVVTHEEMIKGIRGHDNFEPCVVPIVENTAYERDLTDRLAAAIDAYPRAQAVLVRRHGVYVWGSDWEEAKRHAECYDYLFDFYVRMRQAGLDPTAAPAVAASGAEAAESPSRKRARLPSPKAAPRHKAALLDIEGTVTPISFVKDVLFPYARQHVRSFLEQGWGDAEVQAAIAGVWNEAKEDEATAVPGAVSVPAMPPKGSKATDATVRAFLDALVRSVKWQMDQQRKSKPLKQLQGLIWRRGYAEGKLRGPIYADVLPALKAWTGAGMKVYIYSSGSREAQRLLFGHCGVLPAACSAPGADPALAKSASLQSPHDVRPLLSGFFDLSTGSKRESASYSSIVDTLGLDSPGELLFATDVPAEAQAAKAAGVDAVLVARPGNAELPAGHGFPVVHSLDEIQL